MSEYKLTVQAGQDLEDAYEYLYKQNPDAALKLLEALEDRCASLVDMPGQGKQRNEFNQFANGIRSVAEHNYTIFFRQTNYGVLIIRFLHHSRDIDKFFNQDNYNER